MPYFWAVFPPYRILAKPLVFIRASRLVEWHRALYIFKRMQLIVGKAEG
jgi:hypothetical protein